MRPLLAYLAMAATCLAGTTDDGIPDSVYLDYGRHFAPYTLRVVGTTARDGKPFVGSGVAIADQWVLTAAHVMTDAAVCAVKSGTTFNRVERVFIPIEYRGGFGEHDIAALRVERPIGLRRYPPLRCEPDERTGAVVSIAGYGVTGRISTGHSASDGQIRAGTGRVVRFERRCIICPIQRGGSPMPFGIAPGDSGGPLFLDGKLTGINSFTMADTGPLMSKAGEESGHTRVALYHDWLHDVMGEEFDAICSVESCTRSRSR